jgi:hypothetical protein
VYLALDGAIFRSGWYSRYLEPNSTTGQVESHLYWLRRAKPAKVPEVLVVGDSRIAEGFSSRTAEATVQGRLHFTNLGVPGSSPRVWYYEVRDGDPTRNRFAAIVLAMDHYSDEDGGEDGRNRVSDMNYLAGRLRLTDCSEFSDSFTERKLRREIFRQCLFPGTVLRSDVAAFLTNIPDRLDRAGDWREKGDGYIDGYGGKPEDLAGLTIDWQKRTIEFPPGAKDWQKDSAHGTLLPDPAPQTGALTKYRNLWLGRLLDLYKDSKTKIVFLQLPRAPLPLPDSPVPPRFLNSVSSRPNVVVLPAETFQDLERPDVFADGLHLNHAGRPLFSTTLAQRIADSTGVN